MTTLLGASWRTTIMGYVVAAVLYVQEMVNAGTALPKDKHGWMTLIIAAAIAIWGHQQKDATVSNAPNPLPEAQPVK
jgi:hypothetical protein